MTVRVLGVAVLVLGLTACGDPQGAAPGAAGGDPSDDPAETTEPAEAAAIAPDCEELWAAWVADQPTTPATPSPPEVDTEELMAWVEQEAADDFGGLRMDPPGSGQITISFTGDVDAHRAALHERFGDAVTVEAVERSMAELEALQREVDEEMRARAGDAEDPDRDRYRPPPGTIFSSGISAFNRVSVGVVGGDDAALAEISARYGADRICLEVHEPPPPMDPDGPVRPLAKAEGWRSGLATDAYALAEIAFDAETARRAWQENVPDGLPARGGGDPAEDGIYGSLDDVDFAEQAVVVWSSGQSGSCPGWLADIEVGADGRVEVTHGAAGVGFCTSDYNDYRMVLAVDRARLPAPGDLPVPEREGDPGRSANVRAYP